MMRLTCAALLLVSMAGAAFAAPPVPPAPPASSSTLPSEPLVVDLKAAGRLPGKRGGTLRMLMSKEKDVRLLNTWGYARLVGWTSKLELKPDLLKAIEVKDGRIFTMRLRAGHKWSDGSPFTAEDFRYFWDDVASNKELSPAGPPVDLINGGELPKVEIVDPLTVRYTWSKPNSRFLAACPRQAATSPSRVSSQSRLPGSRVCSSARCSAA